MSKLPTASLVAFKPDQNLAAVVEHVGAIGISGERLIYFLGRSIAPLGRRQCR